MIILRKLDWKKFNHPMGFLGDWYVWGSITVCVAKENSLWHISVSHPMRYPHWNEIYNAWYDLVPDAAQINGAIILPRKSEYVNLHPNCFHVHQLADKEIPGGIIV